MSLGRLIAVVGPSGVGKDSVMLGIQAARPEIQLVKRTITRAPDLGGEDYNAVTVQEFEHTAKTGGFAVHWGAHELFYGIPTKVHADVAAGTTCLANFSRGALMKGADAFDNFIVLNITASEDTLVQRLRNRGRENEEQIQKRLEQANKPLPKGLNVIQLGNDDALEHTVARAVHLLYPESA